MYVVAVGYACPDDADVVVAAVDELAVDELVVERRLREDDLQLTACAVATYVAHKFYLEVDIVGVVDGHDLRFRTAVFVGDNHGICAGDEAVYHVVGARNRFAADVPRVGVRLRARAAAYVKVYRAVGVAVARRTRGRGGHFQQVGLGDCPAIIIVVTATAIARFFPVGDDEVVRAGGQIRGYARGDIRAVFRQFISRHDVGWRGVGGYHFFQRRYVVEAGVPVVAVVAHAVLYRRRNLTICAALTVDVAHHSAHFHSRVQFRRRLRHLTLICVGDVERVDAAACDVRCNVVAAESEIFIRRRWHRSLVYGPTECVLAVGGHRRGVVAHVANISARRRTTRNASVTYVVVVVVNNFDGASVDVAVVAGDFKFEDDFLSRRNFERFARVAAVGVGDGEHVGAGRQIANLHLARRVARRTSPAVGQIRVAFCRDVGVDGAVVVRAVAGLIFHRRRTPVDVLAVAEAERNFFVVRAFNLTAKKVRAAVGDNQNVVANGEAGDGFLVRVFAHDDVVRRALGFIAPLVSERAAVARDGHFDAAVSCRARARWIFLFVFNFKVDNFERTAHRTLAVGVVVPDVERVGAGR